MQKLIYVRNEDTWLIERAQQLFDENLSVVMMKALREYIQRFEEDAGMEKVTIRVGKHLTNDGGGIFRIVGFEGKRLAEWKAEQVAFNECDTPFSEFEVYLRGNKNNVAGVVLVERRWECEKVSPSTFRWYHNCRLFQSPSLKELQEEYGKHSDINIQDLMDLASEALAEFLDERPTGGKKA